MRFANGPTASSRVGDLVSADLAALAEAVRRARTGLAEAEAARDVGIRAALASGVSVAEVATVTGLHQQRIYQIRRRDV